MPFTVKGCYDKNGQQPTVNTKQEVVYPPLPEPIPFPTPAKGAQNAANSLAHDVDPEQQPGLI